MKEKIMKIIPDEIEIDGTGIKVKEFIDFNTYVSILEDIKKNVFYNSNAEEKSILMELRYIQDVIEKCTNLKDEIVEPEEFYNPYLKDFLAKNIDNFEEVFLRIEKEYDRYVMENCFTSVANRMPSAEEMEKSGKSLIEMIKNIPEDKLELIAKSIAWNQSPVLGNMIAPVQKVEAEPILSEV